MDRRQLGVHRGHAGQARAFHIGWSLKLTNEAGYMVALLAGLLIGNFFPSAAARLKEAIRPELYIKMAIVILGGFLGRHGRRATRAWRRR